MIKFLSLNTIFQEESDALTKLKEERLAAYNAKKSKST